MLNRRDFGLGLGALGLGAGLPAIAQNVRVMRLANTAAVNDPQQCFVTAGQHPRLNFYKPGGVDPEYVNMSSMTQALQSLRAGHVEFGPAVPGILVPAMAKDPSLDLVSVYKWLPGNANTVVVKPASPIQSVADLAGKRIGVRSQGDAGVVVLKAMLAELGWPGLILFLWINIGGFFMTLGIHDKLRNEDLKKVAGASMLIQVGLTVAGLTGGTVLFSLPGSAYYWTALGLATVLPRLDDPPPEEGQGVVA